jgi:murein L,D-transpeptidase YcbB/YkuD
LVDIVDEPDVPVQKIPVGGIIRPGDTSPRIPAIRARMGLPGDSRVYDETLARRVMAFQETRGVAPDAVIGGETVKLMNATRQDRINQILANLERLRWIDQDKPSRYILVNIPSATLWAVEEGDTILQMPVVVGKVKRPTIAFRTDVTGVRFNPNWTVPPTIKNEDFLPALQEDPLYLSKRGIEITTGFGRESQTIDPTTVDWADMTTEDLKGLNMIQSPGTTNPLGRVRVIMPNGYNIYLHDTNAPEYLQRSNRTLSSGCIRVAEPVKLADFILKDKAGWDQTRTDKVLESARMTEVMTDVKLPVYILYQTVWQDERGGIIFGPDVYGEDAVIAAQLRARGAIHIPGTPEKSVKSAGYSGKTALAKGGINP